MVPFDIAVVFTLMLIGGWLENINGKDGWFDELLTPLPMGLCGLFVLAERALV